MKLSFLFLFCLLLALYSMAIIDDTEIKDNKQKPSNYEYELEHYLAENSHAIKVTNLNSHGPGSLRWAIEKNGARIIHFDVSGVIDLKMQNLKIRNPYLLIKGESAPSPGITIIKGGLRVETHDVIISHLKVRPGDAFQEKKSGWKPDAITITGDITKNVVIKNCSLTWAVDEIIGINIDRKKKNFSSNVIIKNTIISEALNNSSHPEGAHSKGLLVHDDVQGVTIENNLFSHNMKRNPYLKRNTKSIIRGNIIYNPGRKAIHLSSDYHEALKWGSSTYLFSHSVAIDNILIPGVNTPNNINFISGKGVIYEKNNKILGKNFRAVGNKYYMDSFNIIENNREYNKVLLCKRLSEVGARPWEKDSIDLRILRDVIDRSGRIIDSQSQVGGYPKSIKQSKINESTWVHGKAFNYSIYDYCNNKISKRTFDE